MPRFATPVLLTLVLSCAACSKPEPPPTDEPPQPQVQAAPAAEQNTQLRDAIRAPIDKAKAVEGAVQEAADQQRAEIEAAGG